MNSYLAKQENKVDHKSESKSKDFERVEVPSKPTLTFTTNSKSKPVH